MEKRLTVAARAAVSLIVSQYVSAVLGLILTIVAARLLGLRAYGTAGLVLAFPMMILQLSATKATSVVTRHAAESWARGSPAQVHAAVRAGALIDLAAAVVCAVIVGVSASFVATRIYHDSSLALLMVLVGLSGVVASPIGGGQSLLLSTGRARVAGLLLVMESAVTLVAFGVAALFVSVTHVHLVLAVTIGQVVTGVVHVLVANTVLTRLGARALHRRIKTDGLRIRSLRADFAWNWTVMTMSGIGTQLPLLIVGWRLGPSPAGAFRLATLVGSTASFVEGGLAKVVYPEIAQRGSVAKAQLIRWTTTTGIPLGILVCCSIPVLWFATPYALGEDYSAARVPMAACLLAAAVSTTVFWAVPKLYAEGRLRELARLQVPYTVCSIATVVVGIQWAGVAGAAIALMLCRIGYAISCALASTQTQNCA